MTAATFDFDWRLRLAAFAELEGLSSIRGGVVSSSDLARGFEFEGHRIRFWDPRRGIWRPKQLGENRAALTIVTAPPRAGKVPPYDDQVASDADVLIYRYEGTGQTGHTRFCRARAVTTTTSIRTR